MTKNEFDEFIMLYIKDRIESLEEVSSEDVDQDPELLIFSEFISRLKGKAFWPLLQKSMLKMEMKQRTNNKRFVTRTNDMMDRDRINILI